MLKQLQGRLNKTLSSPTSESEEMYLIHIAMAGERGVSGEVPLRLLADGLSVTPISANQMIKKLATKGLVGYTPYHGVELTSEGEAIAARVLRHRRLWATFLAKQLGFSPTEADEIACDLEHVTSNQVAARLSSMLGNPEKTPGGTPIPPESGILPEISAIPLAGAGVGDQLHVVSVNAEGAESSFLSGSGLKEGVNLLVKAIGTRGDMLVRVGSGCVHLDSETVSSIAVVPVS